MGATACSFGKGFLFGLGAGGQEGSRNGSTKNER